MAFIYLAHLAVPFVAIAWLAFAPLPSKRWRLIQTVCVGLILAGLWIAGLWFYPPGWVRWVHAALFALAAWRAWRSPARATTTFGTAIGASSAVVFGAIGVLCLAQGVSGRQHPQRTFDLGDPLAGGRFCVISGGASPLLNFHMATLAPEYASFRGQSYGADFVAVGASGLRAKSQLPQPADLDAYYVYGARVLAPCSGSVVAVGDGLPDRAIGNPDRTNLPGNHVVLLCERNQVLLAHMQPGSIRVSEGAVVATGQLIGAVGNSGNSDEPHLHISVQRTPLDGAAPQSGEPVHMTFGGRFLARGDCLR